MSSSHRRGPWSQGEDGYLVQLVHTQGALNWVRIAQLIGSRSPKQCRERYHQNLKPSLNHEPISPEEGLQIERMVGEMGKRWAEIARRLHGRSDNAVKNWWNGSMNRRRRVDIRRRPSTHQPSHYVERPQQFVRPNAANRPLSITSTGFPPQRGSGMDGPLPSPAVSEASRSESTDGAPSLVSDNSSAFSVSPRLAQPLYLDLPPLNSYPRDNRRPSLPMIPFRAPPNYASEGDSSAYTFTSRFVGESKTPAMNMHSPAVFQRTDYHMPPHSPRGYHTESRAQLLTAPPTPVQLPPLELNQQSDRRDPASERDTRMHLSSLLA